MRVLSAIARLSFFTIIIINVGLLWTNLLQYRKGGARNNSADSEGISRLVSTRCVNYYEPPSRIRRPQELRSFSRLCDTPSSAAECGTRAAVSRSPLYLQPGTIQVNDGNKLTAEPET